MGWDKATLALRGFELLWTMSISCLPARSFLLLASSIFSSPCLLCRAVFVVLFLALLRVGGGDAASDNHIRQHKSSHRPCPLSVPGINTHTLLHPTLPSSTAASHLSRPAPLSLRQYTWSSNSPHHCLHHHHHVRSLLLLQARQETQRLLHQAPQRQLHFQTQPGGQILRQRLQILQQAIFLQGWTIQERRQGLIVPVCHVTRSS